MTCLSFSHASPPVISDSPRPPQFLSLTLPSRSTTRCSRGSARPTRESNVGCVLSCSVCRVLVYTLRVFVRGVDSCRHGKRLDSRTTNNDPRWEACVLSWGCCRGPVHFWGCTKEHCWLKSLCVIGASGLSRVRAEPMVVGTWAEQLVDLAIFVALVGHTITAFVCTLILSLVSP